MDKRAINKQMNTVQNMTAAELAARFGCTEEQARSLLRRNAKECRDFAHAATYTQKGTYRGKTADQWRACAVALETKVSK